MPIMYVCSKSSFRIECKTVLKHLNKVDLMQISAELKRQLEICKVEASLLDPLEAVQTKLDDLHYQHQVRCVNEIFQNIN